MLFVFQSGAPMPAVQAVDIPWDANRHPVALRAVGDQWTDLVAPSRAQEALKQNLETLTTCLDGTCRRSLFHTDLTPPTELTMIGAIDSHSPIDTYEQKNLFNLLQEMASTDGTVTLYPDGFLMQNSFGSIGANRGRQIWENTEICLCVNDTSAYQSFLAKLEERDQALHAGRFFADKLRQIVQNSECNPENGDPVEVGSYTFQGVDGPAAAAAFLARNIPQFMNRSPVQIADDIQSIIRLLPSRRVTALEDGKTYEINADFLTYRLQRNAEGTVELSARLHPKQLIRDAKVWFSSSTAAQELTSILLATGVAQVLPKLVIHATEVDTTLRWGNGYASLSRMICGMISHSRDSDRKKLVELDDLFHGTLADHLSHFRTMSSSAATHLVLDLLIGVLGKSSPAQSLPVFKGPTTQHDQSENSCDDAEGYFVSSVKGESYTTDAYFLYKKSGQQTALTRVPIVIEGTVIPKGTLCLVHKDDGGTIEWVKPLRLTLFNLPLDGEGAEVFQHHLYKMNKFGRSDDDARAVYRALDEIE